MTSAAGTQLNDKTHARTAAAAGSLVAAIAASSCCILPVGLFMLGASGAWIGTLVQLAPLQPYFIAAAVLCLAAGYWLVYRSRTVCVGTACGSNLAGWPVKSALIVATVLTVLAIGFNFAAPLLLS